MDSRVIFVLHLGLSSIHMQKKNYKSAVLKEWRRLNVAKKASFQVIGCTCFLMTCCDTNENWRLAKMLL